MESELADHERYGRHVREARLAQVSVDDFKTWSRDYDRATKRMRDRLSKPAVRQLTMKGPKSGL